MWKHSPLESWQLQGGCNFLALRKIWAVWIGWSKLCNSDSLLYRFEAEVSYFALSVQSTAFFKFVRLRSPCGGWFLCARLRMTYKDVSCVTHWKDFCFIFLWLFYSESRVNNWSNLETKLGWWAIYVFRRIIALQRRISLILSCGWHVQNICFSTLQRRKSSWLSTWEHDGMENCFNCTALFRWVCIIKNVNSAVYFICVCF